MTPRSLTPEEVDDFLWETYDRDIDYWMEEETPMDEIRNALADSLKSTQPRLYGLLGEAVRRGEGKGRIIARLAGVIHIAHEPPAGELTLGCCEAAIDRFIELLPDPFADADPSDDPPEAPRQRAVDDPEFPDADLELWRLGDPFAD